MKKNILFLSLCAICLFIIGCQSKTDTDGTENNGEGTTQNESEVVPETTNNNNDETEGDFPITVELGDQSIEITEKPERILPLSLDVTEIVLELVDSSRVVATTAGIEDPMLSTQTDKAEDIPNRVSSAAQIDPEEILSFDTDLLLLTELHGQEADANKILSEIDLPMLTFEAMHTVDSLLENIEVIGQAVGEPEKATELIKDMEADIAAIQDKIPDDTDPPSVLVLSEVGPGTGPFMLGPSNISYDIIKLAGAKPAVDEIDLENSTPASIEQVLKMDPDYIFLLDFAGKGEDVFTDLMSDPGWDSLRAIEDERVAVLDVKYLMNPNIEIIEGLDKMVDLIYSE